MSVGSMCPMLLYFNEWLDKNYVHILFTECEKTLQYKHII